MHKRRNRNLVWALVALAICLLLYAVIVGTAFQDTQQQAAWNAQTDTAIIRLTVEAGLPP